MDLFNPAFLYGRFQPVRFSSTQHPPSENNFAGLFPVELLYWISRQTLQSIFLMDRAKPLTGFFNSIYIKEKRGSVFLGKITLIIELLILSAD
jgi:hypothetical protein